MNIKRKRMLGVLLAACMGLMLIPAGALPASAEAAAVQIDPPGVNDYLFNGTYVTDRSKFSLLLDDWRLGTSDSTPAMIVAGDTAGEGVSYDEALSESWYMGLQVAASGESDARVTLTDGETKLSLGFARGADGKTAISLLEGESTLIAIGEAPAGNVTFDLILDNTLGGALRVHITGDDGFATHVEIGGLSDGAKALLAGVTGIRFASSAVGVRFTEFCINNRTYRYEGRPAEALAFLEALAKQEIEGSVVPAADGTPMYTPDGVKNYNALWTRDFTYRAQYAPEYIPTEDKIDCVEYLLEHARESDGWIPDRVYDNGVTGYSAGDLVNPAGKANLDNCAFIVLAMETCLKEMEPEAAKAFFLKWEDALMRALDAVPKDAEGLVYNDPLDPHSPYGFTDCILKTGSLMKESLLLWEAYSIMADRQAEYGQSSAVARAAADAIEEALIPTFKNSDGMLNAATADCCQTDIWGSCYAVFIGFPMEASLKDSIAQYLVDNYDGLVQFGQIRHTAPGTYWEKLLSGVDRDTYQNGAYWGTPTAWFIAAIQDKSPELAQRTLEDLIAYFETYGNYECVNGSYRKLNHYITTISNIMPAAREMLQVKIPATGVAVTGSQALKTGMTGQYTATVAPADATLASLEWTVNGAAAGTGNTLSYRFTEAGSYTVTATATDRDGGVKTDSLTVVVTDHELDEVVLTASRIQGKAGDIVSLTVSVEENSYLSSADFLFTKPDGQEEIFEVVESADGDSPYAVFSSLWDDGLAASNLFSDGSMHISIARAGAGLTEGGVLFTVQLRLLTDVDTPVEWLIAVPECRINSGDGSGSRGAPAMVYWTGGTTPTVPSQPTASTGATGSTAASVTTGGGTAGSSSPTTAGAGKPHTGSAFPLAAAALAVAAGSLLVLFGRRKSR